MENNFETSEFNNFIEIIKSGKIPHALIIEGSDSDFLLKRALEIVQTALCQNKAKPCGTCANCVKVLSKSHPDVKIISSEGDSKSIKIESVRQIREDAHIISNEGGYKFYIISGGDFLTVQAQNAFIKVLEEPPKNVAFIILCKSALSMLATVRSRCEIFKAGNFEQKDFSEQDLLAQKIVSESLKKNKFEVMKLVASAPQNRESVKNLSQKITHEFIKAYASDEKFCISEHELAEKIDFLKHISNSADKNININLLACFLCAGL